MGRLTTDRRPRLTTERLRRTEVLEWDDPLPGWEQGEVFYEIEQSAWLER